MKFLIVLFFVSTALLLLNNCDNTEPVDELKPGRRDYAWTVDTLNYPFAPLTRIWGSSPTDVWAISPGDWDKSISHFNGISWQQIGLPYNPQSQISLIAKQKGNTVVAVGSNGSKAFIILLNR